MRGCHEDRVFRQLTDHELESVLLPARDVLRILTVSPKMVSAAQIERLVAAGITVFLGHTEATYEEATAAFSAGARGVTHLFNAMSGMTRGEPGTVGAALAAPGAWAGVIADGVHVHPGSLTAAKRAKGDHLVLVSDAMPPLGVGDSSFRLGPHDIRCIDGRCTTADGTLAGSAVPVVKGVRTYVQRCGIPLEEGLRMASTYPARLLVAAGTGRLGASQIGTIAPGSAADLVILGPDLQVRGTVRRGAVRFRS
jgi:N-acetylglucosamine-6-phosphate deacetylase